MLQRHTHAIVAPATAGGRAAVGVVRVSGLGLAPFVRALLGFEPQPRHAHYTPFRDDQGQVLDEGLALWFPAPHSYTGEDVLELQGHGGPVVMQMLIDRCREVGQPLLPGLRLADPGEFTQRAFLNGKLDLAQAEAVADLIDAGTEAAARSASASLGGAFSREVEALREPLVALRVLLESTLDFPEEEIDLLEQHDVAQRLMRLAQALAAVQARARQGALLREGLQIVLAGQPNVGKSSLLNALAGTEVAIVTPLAGTTRDPVRQALQIEGIPLHVVDTAGLRDSDDLVERIGIERSWAAVREADAVLFVHDLTRRGEPAYEEADVAIAERLGLPGAKAGAPLILHVHNKLDLAGQPAADVPLCVSARSGVGLDELRRALLAQVGWQAVPEGVFIARARHLQALGDAARAVTEAKAHLVGPSPALELCAQALREAHDALGHIVGAMTADDLLGEIFARFCIGK